MFPFTLFVAIRYILILSVEMTEIGAGKGSILSGGAFGFGDFRLCFLTVSYVPDRQALLFGVADCVGGAAIITGTVGDAVGRAIYKVSISC